MRCVSQLHFVVLCFIFSIFVRATYIWWPCWTSCGLETTVNPDSPNHYPSTIGHKCVKTGSQWTHRWNQLIYQTVGASLRFDEERIIIRIITGHVKKKKKLANRSSIDRFRIMHIYCMYGCVAERRLHMITSTNFSICCTHNIILKMWYLALLVILISVFEHSLHSSQHCMDEKCVLCSTGIATVALDLGSFSSGTTVFFTL